MKDLTPWLYDDGGSVWIQLSGVLLPLWRVKYWLGDFRGDVFGDGYFERSGEINQALLSWNQAMPENMVIYIKNKQSQPSIICFHAQNAAFAAKA